MSPLTRTSSTVTLLSVVFCDAISRRAVQTAALLRAGSVFGRMQTASSA
jgi:hypothetical protein